jgi:hypothetical protein
LGEEQNCISAVCPIGRGINFDQALEADDTLLTRQSANCGGLSYGACLCRDGDAEMASMWMSRAVQTGWMYRTMFSATRIFAAVLKDDRFRRIVDQMERVPGVLRRLAFRSTYWWSPTGIPSMAGPTKAEISCFSTMLAITDEWEFLTGSARPIVTERTADGTRPAASFLFLGMTKRCADHLAASRNHADHRTSAGPV